MKTYVIGLLAHDSSDDISMHKVQANDLKAAAKEAFDVYFKKSKEEESSIISGSELYFEKWMEKVGSDDWPTISASFFDEGMDIGYLEL